MGEAWVRFLQEVRNAARSITGRAALYLDSAFTLEDDPDRDQVKLALDADRVRALVMPAELSPSGGSNDGTSIQAALEANAYGEPVVLSPGTYYVASTIDFPNGATLVGGPGVQIISTITPSGSPGSPDHAIFYAVPPAPTVSTTLAAAVVPGAYTITVASASGFSVGQEIAITSDNQTAGYVIAGIAGSVITVDRPIVHYFMNGSAVIERIAPKDMRIIGNGMRIDGTGDAVVEWSGAWRCEVSGLVTETNHGKRQFVEVNFDVGSRFCVLRDCDFDCGGGADATDSGWHFESAEECRAEHVRARRAYNQAWFVSSGYGCVIDSCSASESGTGGVANLAEVIDDGSGYSAGAKGLLIVGCTFTKNTGIGLDILNGSRRVSVVGCQAWHNGGTGYAVNSGVTVGASASSITTFAACHAYANGGAGFYVSAGVRDVHLAACTSDRNASAGIEGEGEWTAVGFTSRDCTLGGVRVGAAGRAAMTHSLLSSSLDTTVSAWAAFVNQSTDPLALRVHDADIRMSGAGTKIAISCQAAGNVSAEGLRVNTTGSTGTTYGWVASAGTFYEGGRVDMSAATTPYLGGTVYYERRVVGPVTADYTASWGETVLVDPTAGGVVITIPAAATANRGRRVKVKNDSASTNAITVTPSGGQLIDGAASYAITQARASVSVESAGSKVVLT